MNIDSGHQYLQTELPSDIFNSGNGDVKNYNGRAVRVGVNNNGTRSLSDLGDYNTYQNQKSITDALANQQTQFNNMVTQGKQDVTDFLGKYGQDTQNTIASTSAKYHLPEQTDYVNALNSRIQDLKGNLSGSGAGGFASSDQVDQALNTRYLPQFETGISNLDTSTQLAQNENQQLLQPDVTAGQLLNDRLAREMTGFTTEQQNTLQGLIEQLKAGTQLTQAQIEAANQLAIAKENYQSYVDAARVANQRPQNVPAGSYVYNPATGEYKRLG